MNTRVEKILSLEDSRYILEFEMEAKDDKSIAGLESKMLAKEVDITNLRGHSS